MTGKVWLALRDLIAGREVRRAQERAEEATVLVQKAERVKKFAVAFESCQLAAGDRDAIMRKTARAFQDSEREPMLSAFPSDLCTDGGWRIHNGLEGWGDTLPGTARRACESWRDDLRPLRFRFFSRIATFPGGMPGEAGGFFSWPKELEE